MRKPNTKTHWTALAVAAYYDKYGTACRARDLYPMVTAFHETSDSLISALHRLKTEGTIGFAPVQIEGKGAQGRLFAYYPTNITIEDLRDIGLPTELPDGSAIPEEYDLDLPTERVSGEAEKAGDIPLPDTDRPPLEYETMGKSRTAKQIRENPREYSTEDRFESDAAHLDFGNSDSKPDYDLDEPTAEAVGTLNDTEEDEVEVEVEDEAEETLACRYCGRDDLETPGGRGSHEKYCLSELHEQALDEYQAQQASELTCPYCGRADFNRPKEYDPHKQYCLNELHEQALDEYQGTEAEAEETLTCRYCGRDDFSRPQGLGSHKKYCLSELHEQALAEYQGTEGEAEETLTCPYCGRDDFSRPQGLGSHKNACLNGLHEKALDEYHAPTLTCRYCGRDDLESPGGRGIHEKSCLKRIHRQALAEYQATMTEAAEVDDDLSHMEARGVEFTPVGHDFSYMAERGLDTSPTSPEWDWEDVSERLYEMAEDAHHAGLHRISAVYMNFGALAMERDLNENAGVEMEAEAILTKELALMLLGAHHRELAASVIEDEALALVKESRKAHEVMK